MFLAGFLFDAIMLPDLNDLLARYIGLGYLFSVAFLIMFREWVVSRNTASEFEQKIYSLSTFGISYFSGSALSFIFIYALRSAALSVSWPLFIILFLCIIANESVSTHNFRFAIDLGVLLIATLFYIIFNTPLVLKTQNDTIFGISIIVTIVISLLYVHFLKYFSETATHEAPRSYALSIGIPMFVGMLYVLNIIPAVPLSLSSGGVYHNVTRNNEGGFSGFTELDNDKIFAKYRTSIYHLTPIDTGVYFFSSVNAPAELTAPISHVWEYQDEKTLKWTPVETVSFDLSGGREEGYRAYSKKENITEGLWRVTVKVDTKRIVGRVTFRVIKTDTEIKTKEVDL
jgi:hypothetical protein